jgi:hypothetical protein
MPKVTYDNIEFDSVGELYFYWWCSELKEAGYIDNFVTQPSPIILSEKVTEEYIIPMKKVADKVKSHTLMNGHIYTYDSLIRFTMQGSHLLCFDLLLDEFNKSRDTGKLISKDCYCRIELKPKFDQNNMTRLAVINQKWVYDKTGKFINIVIPEKLFEKTFTPKRYLLTDVSKTKRKINFKTRSLEEFVKINTSDQLSII